jgi:hypothetical protein
MKKITDWDAMGAAGNDAALSENDDQGVSLRTKTIKTIPSNYFEAHSQLKKSGKTGLLLTAYMIEALREKLARDGAL